MTYPPSPGPAHGSVPEPAPAWRPDADEPTEHHEHPPPQDPWTGNPYLLGPHYDDHHLQPTYPVAPEPAAPTRDVPAQPYPAQPYPVSPVTGPPVSGPPISGPPISGPPVSGLPVPGPAVSGRSRITAGLLQLVPGVLISLGGLGRLYAGHRRLGWIQLAASVFSWAMFACGFATVFPFGVFAVIWIWFIVDGVLMVAGKVTDGQGRPLR
jgi:hypothetical protein